MNCEFPDFKKLFPGRDLVKEWAMRPGTYHIPPIVDLETSIDNKALLDLYYELDPIDKNDFENWVMKQRRDITGNKDLNNYYQKVLTHPTQLSRKYQAEVDKIKCSLWVDRSPPVRQLIKALKNLDQNYEPLMDERNYVVVDPVYRGTYLEEVFDKIGGRVTRARFARLGPGERLLPHIGMTPKYTLRLHIPLVTNSKCYNVSSYKGDLVKRHLAPGKLYLINTGTTHWAVNQGTSERIHLVMGVDGFEHNRLKVGCA